MSPKLAARYRRRRAALSFAAVIVIVSTVVLIAVYSSSSSHETSGRQGTSDTPITAAPLSIQSLAASVDTALAAHGPELVFHSSGSGREYWVDFTGQAVLNRTVDASGERIRDLAARPKPGADGVTEALVIDYAARTWSIHEATASPGAPLARVPDPIASLKEQLAQNLNDGTSIVKSEEVVDGRTLVRIDTTASAGETTIVSSMWIDRATSLPVKQSVPGLAGVTYQWDLRSPAVLARLWPTVPAGFQQVEFTGL